MRQLLPLLLLIAAAGPARAAAELKDKVAYQVREVFGIPGSVPLEMGATSPAEIDGLLKAPLTLGAGAEAQIRTVYVTQDGKHWFMTEIHGLDENLDVERSRRLKPEGPFRGTAGAPISVVEFSDLECPYCKKAHQLLSEKLLTAYPGQIEWSYKQFPLTNIHPWSEKAAVAAECARRQKGEGFWKLVDQFFQNQEQVNPGNVRDKSLEFAKQAGLDEAAFTACFDGQKTLEDVKRQAAEGDKLEVSSTPTFFVNGHAIRGVRDFSLFQQLIDDILAGKHVPPR